MKNLIIISLIISLLGCNVKSEETKSEIKIEAVSVKPITYKNICFQLDSSTYPEIKGMEDEFFQKELNAILYKNFKSEVDSALLGQVCEEPDYYEGMDEESKKFEIRRLSIFPSLNSGYKILKKDSIISIIQYFYYYVGGAGNGRLDITRVSNFDLKNRVILNQSDFSSKIDNTLIERGIKTFLDKHVFNDPIYAGENRSYVQYPTFKNKKITLEELKYALRKDSVMIVVNLDDYYSRAEQFPRTVPICKWPIKKSHAIFKK